MSKKTIDFTVGDLRKAIPAHLFKKNEARFLVSVGHSVGLTFLLGYLAFYYIPLTLWAIPLWIAYTLLQGTVTFGIWIMGHECGHGAFSDSPILNDILGYILHTALLVPYFSWQHSHSVHHAKTNHLTEGESHVPAIHQSAHGGFYRKIKTVLGDDSFALVQLFFITIPGWPLYLLFGCTGGPARGFTSHFIVPNQLFPKRLLTKVFISNLGLLAVIYGLYLWAQVTSAAHVFGVYVAPYIVVNAWLAIVTLLQHTEINVLHYDHTSWNWFKGAMLGTIDRNYPKWIDAAQFFIGTTHVMHHIFSDLPHYNAEMANIYVKEKLGSLYNYDSKELFGSLYRSAQLVAVEDVGNGEWKYVL